MKLTNYLKDKLVHLSLFFCLLISIEIDESIFSMFQMRDANRKSIALDGIEDVIDGKLIYTDILVEKVRNTFRVDLPKVVHFTEIDEVGAFIVEQIIERNK